MDHLPALIVHPFPRPPATGEALEVAEGLFWLRLPLPMALDHVNIYALDEGDSWTLVDTGLDSRLSREVWDRILAGPLAGRPVRQVIVTHHHPDHVGLAGWFQAQGAALWMPRTGWLMARMLVLDEQSVASPELMEFWRAAGVEPATLADRAGQRPFNFADCVAPMPLGFHRVQQGDVMRFGGRVWDVHIGNGHAPEHATFWCRDEALVIGGDQLLPGISANLGAYATEPDADPVAEWLETCQRFQPLAQEDQLVLPGHKLPYTGLPHRLTQMIGTHHGALSRLYEILQAPHTAIDCFGALFGRSVGQTEFGLALAESVAHLNHLLGTGQITRTRRQDGAWLWQHR